MQKPPQMNRVPVEPSLTPSLEFGEASQKKPSESRNPISIAMLFYVLTLAAIVAACLGRLSVSARVTSGAVVSAAIACSFVGLLIGFLGGTFYFKSVKASLIGLAVGTGLGAVAGALTLIAEEHFVPLMTIAFAGSWLLVVAILMAARWRVR
jgi:hypothetical protein